MNRKIVVCLLPTVLLATVSFAEAQQQKKVPRIGWLATASTTTDMNEAFRQGLRQLGYVEGKNIVIEYRSAEKDDRLPSFATELVGLKVDVILGAGGPQSVVAAKNATTTIPIIMVIGDDPVGMGLVQSLARPGGNITGLSSGTGPGLQGKRLELLKESFPKVSRVAVLWNSIPNSVRHKREYEAAAGSLGIKLQSAEMRDPNDLERAFSAMKKEGAEALVTINSPVVGSQRQRIVDLAAKSRLPTMSFDSRWTEAGGLMSYGPSYSDLYRRAAIFVDKILKGAKPADLPVEQPTRFELVINLKTAKALGLTIPQSVLFRADKVIQ